MQRNRQPEQFSRRGAVAVLTAVMMAVLLAMVAFGVDVGYILVVRTELQAAADSSAMAAAAVMSEESEVIIATAKQFAGLHKAGAKTVSLDDSDVEFGNWDAATKTFTPSTTVGNAIRVTAHRDSSNSTGEGSLFFARIFGHSTFAAQASAIAMCNPRDIAFVVDLSGSMNDDTEPCWATSEVNTKFAADGYPTVGDTLMEQVYADLNYGTFPGTLQFIGSSLGGLPTDQNAYKEMTKNNGKLTAGTIQAQYRISNSDNETTRKLKAYKWIIDKQIKVIMPNAKPDPNTTTNYAYWAKYIDYILWLTYDGNRGGILPPDWTVLKIETLNNPNAASFPSASTSVPYGFRNQVGYRTYVQFMMDHGRDLQPVSGAYVSLSLDSPHVRMHSESTAGGTFSFPPREQPVHACRRSLIAALQLIKERNQAIPDLNQRDWVSVISFDKVDGDGPVVHQELTGEYGDAMLVCTKLQAVADNTASTATEVGLIAAKDHVKSTAEGGAGRHNSQKVVVLLTDGMPNLYMSSDSDIDAYRTANASDNYYGGGHYAQDSALMQATAMEGKKWMVFPVGIGLGTDYDFMDRCARMGGSANDNGESPRGSGNPAQYEQRLTEIFEDIIKNPRVRLVQ